MGDKLREALQKFSNDLDALRPTMPRQALKAMDFFRRSLDDILVLAEPQQPAFTLKQPYPDQHVLAPPTILPQPASPSLSAEQVEAILCGDVYDINDDPDTPKLTAAINAALEHQVSVTGQSNPREKSK